MAYINAEDLGGTMLASNIVNSSLTSIGTLTNLTVTNPINGNITGHAASADNANTAYTLENPVDINGVSFDGSGNITITDNTKQPLDATLTSLSAFNTNGIITQISTDTFTGRTIAGTTNFITVTNGDGVSGNPTVNIDTTNFLESTSSNILPDASSASAGVSNKAARADHVHQDALIQTTSAQVVSDQTTTSGSLVDIPEASVTLTTQTSTKLLINVSFSISNSSALGATTTVVLVIDGVVEQGSAQTTPTLADSTQCGAFSLLKSGLSAGSHTVKLQWSNSTGTSRIRPVNNPNTEHASITIMEVRL